MRFFPRKALTAATSVTHVPCERLSVAEKFELAERYVVLGELSLLNGSLQSLGYFDAAEALLPESADIWYRGGRAFLDYGINYDQEQALLLASRYFKQAAFLAKKDPKPLIAWGSVLFRLGRTHNEHHFYLSAKEKFEKAISLCNVQSRIENSVLAQLYWDYGLVWIEISERSGEAFDVFAAIQAFLTSKDHFAIPPPEFWNDCGNAHLQMGLLINDDRLLLQAVDFLQNSLLQSPLYRAGRVSLAGAYAQLYLNTADEKYVTLASECYETLCREFPHNSDHWLRWAQLLGESGKINRDPKQLRLSIEKTLRSYSLDAKNPLTTGQWVESLSYLGACTHRLDLLIEAESRILCATNQSQDDADLWHAYGICLLNFGDYYNDSDYYCHAIEKIQYGLSLDRTHAELWHALAQTHVKIAHLTEDLEMAERAHRFFLRALDLKPSCPLLIFDTANAYLLSCDLRDHPDDLHRAIQYYELLLHTQRGALLNRPEWLLQYAISVEWLGDFTGDDGYHLRALDLYLHVLLIEPETSKVYLHIAMCLIRLAESSAEPEYYRKAIHYLRFAAKQNEEDDAVFLEWGLALIHLAHHSLDPDAMTKCYVEAEEKLAAAGNLGNLYAAYHLACLYSIVGDYDKAMEFIYKAKRFLVLPSLEELLEDEWLDNLRRTEIFSQFLMRLESRYGNEATDF